MSFWGSIIRGLTYAVMKAKLDIFSAMMVLVSVFLIGTLFAVWHLETWISSPVDPPQRSDVIVSLGGDPGTRVRQALTLYREGWAPRILLLSEDGSGNADPAPYPDLRGGFLIHNGVPSTAILYDTSPQTSWAEAIAVRAWMQRRGWRRVIIVSDPPHTRRLSWIWDQVLRPADLAFLIVPNQSFPLETTHWLNRPDAAAFIMSELKKLVYYRLHYSRDVCATNPECNDQ